MKKTLSVILSLILCLSALAGCSGNKPEESDVTVRLGGLKGPTTMGLVKLLDDAEKGLTENKYEFTMEAAADALTPKLLKGELDVISVPANAAAILANKSGGAVQVIAVNTLGVISIVEKGGSSVNSLSDLKGKTVYATGKGTTPEYVLSYLLGTAGLDIGKDVEIIWKSEPSEVVAQMSAGQASVAMLPQPFVTVAQGKFSDLRIAIDLTEAWDGATGGQSRLCTSVLLARTEFCEKNEKAVIKFLGEFSESVEYVNSHPDDASVLVEKQGIVASDVAKKAIPFCHAVSVTGNEMKAALSGYLKVLFDSKPESVGGALPEDGFYRIFNPER